MDSPFIVTVRKAIRSLPPSDLAIDQLHQKRVELQRQAEEIILKNEVIGKRFLKSTLDELDKEMQYVKVIVKSRLNSMWSSGMGDYDAEYANTKEIALVLEDAILSLQKLWQIYFEEPKHEMPKAQRLTKSVSLAKEKIEKAPNSAMKKVFISYSKSDREYLATAKKHLNLLVRNRKLRIWDDTQLLPGDTWDEAVKRELESADIILFLVSADLLATDYIWDVEMETAMARAEAGKVTVVPVIIRECSWTDAPFGIFSALPSKGAPIATAPDADTAWKEVAEKIGKLC